MGWNKPQWCFSDSKWVIWHLNYNLVYHVVEGPAVKIPSSGSHRLARVRELVSGRAAEQWPA